MNLHQHTVGTSDLTSRHHSTPHTCSGLLTVPQTHQAFPWLRDFVLPGLHSGMFFTLITAEFTPSFHLSLLKYHLSLEAVSNDYVFKKKNPLLPPPPWTSTLSAASFLFIAFTTTWRGTQTDAWPVLFPVMSSAFKTLCGP